jgi:hypothetical protein
MKHRTHRFQLLTGEAGLKVELEEDWELARAGKEIKKSVPMVKSSTG